MTSQYSSSMLSACGEPPDSGENASPNAVPVSARSARSAAGSSRATARRRRMRRGGAAKGSGIVVTGRTTTSRAQGRLPTTEPGRAALGECGAPLGEVARRGELLLDRGLDRELLGHALVQPVVELPLHARVRARGARGEPVEQRAGLGLERLVG